MPEDINVISLSSDYDHLAEQITKAKTASSELVKGMEKDLERIKSITSGIGKRAGGAIMGSFAGLQLTSATSVRGLAEAHRDTLEFQLAGKAMRAGGQALGRAQPTSLIGQKSISMASRGLQGAGGFMDMSLLKMYEGGLESLGATGSKTAATLVRVFSPLKVLFNPVVGGILMAGDAMLSFHEKAVQSREEFEKYTKSLSEFYQVAEKGSGTLKTSQTAIAGMTGAYGKALGVSGKEAGEYFGQTRAAGFDIGSSEQLVRIAAATARAQGKEIGEALQEAITEAKATTGFMTSARKEQYLGRVAGLAGADYQLQRYQGTSIEGAFEKAGSGMKTFQDALENTIEVMASRISGKTAYEPGVLESAKDDVSRVVDIFVDKLREESPVSKAKAGVASGIEKVGSFFGAIGKEQLVASQAAARAQLLGETGELPGVPKSISAIRKLTSIIPFTAPLSQGLQGDILEKRLGGPGKPSGVGPLRTGTEYFRTTGLLARAEQREAEKNVAEGKVGLNEVAARRKYKEAEETTERLRNTVAAIDKKIAQAEDAGQKYELTGEEQSAKGKFIEAQRYLEANKGVKGGVLDRVGSFYGTVGASVGQYGVGAGLIPGLFKGYSEDAKKARMAGMIAAQLGEEEEKRKKEIEEETKRGEAAKKKAEQQEINQGFRLGERGLAKVGSTFMEDTSRALEEKESRLASLATKRSALTAQVKEYQIGLDTKQAGYGKEQLKELKDALANVSEEMNNLAKSTASVSGEFVGLSTSDLFGREMKVASKRTDLGIAAIREEGIIGKADVAEIEKLRGDKSKPISSAARQAIQARIQMIQEEFESNIAPSRLQAQTQLEKGLGGIQVGRMRRLGIATGATPGESKRIESEASGDVGVLRKQAQSVLSIREQMYEQEIEFTRRYAQTVTDIIKTHYDNRINLERTSLYGAEIKNQNAVGFGSQLLQGGRERSGIEMQVFQNLNSLLQERRTERGFKEAGMDMMFGIAGQQLPPEIQMIRGIRNLREQREDYQAQQIMQERKERTEGESSYRSMRTLKRFGYDEKTLGQSESGLNFMLQAYQQAMPDIARRGGPEMLKQIQDRMQQFVTQKEELATRRFIGEERIKGAEEKSTKEQVAAFEKEVSAKGGEKADPRLRADLAQKYAEAAASAGRRGDLGAQAEYTKKQEAILKTLPDEMKKNFGDKQAQMVEYLNSQVKILTDIRSILKGGTTPETRTDKGTVKGAGPGMKSEKPALGPTPESRGGKEESFDSLEKQKEQLLQEEDTQERAEALGEIARKQMKMRGQSKKPIRPSAQSSLTATGEWTNDKDYGPLRGFSAASSPYSYDDIQRAAETIKRKAPAESRRISTKGPEFTEEDKAAWARRGEQRYESAVSPLSEEQKSRRREAEDIATDSRAKLEAIQSAVTFESKWWEKVPKSKGGEGPEEGETGVTIPKENVAGSVDPMKETADKFEKSVDKFSNTTIKVVIDNQGRATASLNGGNSAVAGY